MLEAVAGDRAPRLSRVRITAALAAVASLTAAAFVATPTRGSDRFVELTDDAEVEAFIALGAPPIRIGPRDEILVRRVPVPKAILVPYLSTQVPGWDGKVISMAADMKLSQGEVLSFARELREMGIEKVYYVTPDNKLKLLTASCAAGGSNRNV